MVFSHATSCSGVFRWIAGELLLRRLSCREVWWSFIHRARVSNAIRMTRGVLELTHLFLLGFFCFGWTVGLEAHVLVVPLFAYLWALFCFVWAFAFYNNNRWKKKKVIRKARCQNQTTTKEITKQDGCIWSWGRYYEADKHFTMQVVVTRTNNEEHHRPQNIYFNVC